MLPIANRVCTILKQPGFLVKLHPTMDFYLICAINPKQGKEKTQNEPPTFVFTSNLKDLYKSPREMMKLRGRHS